MGHIKYSGCHFMNGVEMDRTYSYDDITWSVDLDKCTGSSECAQACPMEIVVLKDGKADNIDITKCISCCACVNACPKDAIAHSMCS